MQSFPNLVHFRVQISYPLFQLLSSNSIFFYLKKSKCTSPVDAWYIGYYLLKKFWVLIYR